MTAENQKQRLPRFESVFVRSPIYFATACTEARRKLLSNAAVHESFLHFAQQGSQYGAWVGAYVIMPDNCHLFVATDDEKITPSKWMKSLKWTRRIWQKTFFDHLLGGTEYYSENWKYIRENPVQAGLVQKSGAVAMYGRRLDWNITRVMRHRRS